MELFSLCLQPYNSSSLLYPQATNDALADALKELEATTAALNSCFDEAYGRQSVVSSSGYGTTTSNSSASEEVQLVTSQGMPSHLLPGFVAGRCKSFALLIPLYKYSSII